MDVLLLRCVPKMRDTIAARSVLPSGRAKVAILINVVFWDAVCATAARCSWYIVRRNAATLIGNFVGFHSRSAGVFAGVLAGVLAGVCAEVLAGVLAGVFPRVCAGVLTGALAGVLDRVCAWVLAGVLGGFWDRNRWNRKGNQNRRNRNRPAYEMNRTEPWASWILEPSWLPFGFCLVPFWVHLGVCFAPC